MDTNNTPVGLSISPETGYEHQCRKRAESHFTFSSSSEEEVNMVTTQSTAIIQKIAQTWTLVRPVPRQVAMKVIFIGAAGSGKSSYIHKYITHAFPRRRQYSVGGKIIILFKQSFTASLRFAMASLVWIGKNPALCRAAIIRSFQLSEEVFIMQISFN